MKHKMKNILFAVTVIALFLSGCSTEKVKSNSDINSREWDMIKESAVDTTVVLYHNYTSLDAVKFLEKTLPSKVKANTGIELKVTYKSRTDIYEKLASDMINEKKKGSVDLILLANNGWRTFYEDDLIYGPFLKKIPNYHSYINFDSIEAHYTEGVSIDDYAAPFGRRQFVMTMNEDLMDESPVDFDELLGLIQVQKGRFTVPAPPNETGVKFIETLICNIEGWEKINELPADKEQVKIAIADSIAYMEYMKPYLWKEGTIFPENEADLDALFIEDSVMFSMAMDQNHATKMLYEDIYPEGAKSFVLGDGTVGTVSYLMIPFNSNNKSGAMVMINELLTPTIQGLKYSPKGWGDLPALDTKIMETEEARPINKNIIKRSSIKESILMENRLPNVRKDISDILVEIWFEIMG